jgi:hypothetical protein
MASKKSRAYQQYTSDQLNSAIGLVRAQKASQRAAAKQFSIPQATLSDHLRGRTKPGTAINTLLVRLVLPWVA